jgi:prohibitin 1
MNELIVYIIGFVVLVLALIGLSGLAFVGAGNVGIQDTFGSVSDNVLYPGISLKFPFTSIVNITTKTVELKEEASTPSSEGLMVGVHTSLLYKVDPTKATQIYKTIGLNYQEVVILPTLRSAIREVTAKYEAKALYSGQRDALANEIQVQIEPVLAARGMIIEKVLLRELIIPDQVKNAIEAKLKSEQEAQQMEFVLQKEKKEAERKVIEATGIRDSQDIINKTLTSSYLQYLWISKLNENPNIIYVPIDSQGLTLFRNVDDIPIVKPIDRNGGN